MLDFMQDWDDVKALSIAEGWYVGTITNASFEEFKSKDGTAYKVIRFTVLLEGNLDRVLSDGMTPVDGQIIEYTQFLPNPMDANKPAPKSSKFPNRYHHDLYKFKRFVSSFRITKEQLEQLTESELPSLFIGRTVNVKVRNKVADDGTVYDEASAMVGSKE